MKIFKRLVLILAFFGLIFFAFADEGMWLPHQMKALNLRELGLQMDPAALFTEDGTGLMSAVVYLGGGTAAFVSSDGLILTNHHVAFGALQRASAKENDYLQNGFIAWSRAEEIEAKGYIADVLLGYEEVTEKILAAVKPGMNYLQKYEALDKAVKRLVAEEEKKGEDLRAALTPMYSGLQYYLFRFKRLKDIRIVYAPPQDLGNFGGDIDNWMWPRHTCDFTFLRAYVSRDNKGVDYSPDNVPYKPKSVLKISLEGFKEGEFTFVMGYPGRTYRNFTLSELEFDTQTMKERLELYQDVINFLEKAGEGNREIQIKYASRIQGLSNALKNYQGKIEGMKKIALVEKKRSAESDLLAWVSGNPELQKKYGQVLENIAAFMKKYASFSSKTTLLNNIVGAGFGSALLSQAYTVYRTAEERLKPDLEREPAYQERNLPYIRQSIQLAEKGYELATDRAFFKHQLKKLLAAPAEQIPGALKELFSSKSEKAGEEFVDKLYDATAMADPKRRLELLEMKPEELLALHDPLINLAAELEKELKALREEGKALGQERLDLAKTYQAALLDQKQGRLAPDANSTIRFTYGLIRGYRPRDAVYYAPQTTLTGVIEKDEGKYPFFVPEKLKELYQKKDFGRYEDQNLRDIPACFLNTTNVTGGNSGSPTLNARGEQVGIIFDMTYESVTGDYYVIPDLQRSISVDIRYVLFITEKFSGATHILRELGLGA